jgi:SAM-dependent methyltransferase
MISSTGFWNFSGQRFQQEHVYDPKLSDALVALAKSYQIKKSYDFGCGPAKYVQYFRQNGIESYGFDGNPVTSTFPYCKVQDLTSNFSEEAVDFLLCLEVCEHVPKEHEHKLISTIDRHLNKDGILILSWAVVGQGGLGHVNCQNNEYVIDLFKKMNYIYLNEESDVLRKNSIAPWFKNTVLVFKKC